MEKLKQSAAAVRDSVELRVPPGGQAGPADPTPPAAATLPGLPADPTPPAGQARTTLVDPGPILADAPASQPTLVAPTRMLGQFDPQPSGGAFGAPAPQPSPLPGPPLGAQPPTSAPQASAPPPEQPLAPAHPTAQPFPTPPMGHGADFSNLDPSEPLDADSILADHGGPAKPTVAEPYAPAPAPAAPLGAEPPRSTGAAGFEDQFLGDLDAVGDDDDYGDDDDDYGDDDGYGDDEFGDMAAPAAPMPWVPILIGAAVLVAAGLFFLPDLILGEDAASDDVVASDNAEGDGEPAADDSPAPAADDGKAVPEPATPPVAVAADGGAAPAADGGTPPAAADGGTPPPAAADGGTPPPTAADGGTPPAAPAATPPAPSGPAPKLDAASEAKLAEARELWESAKGRKKSKLNQARAILEELQAAHPTHPITLLVLAQVQLELGASKEGLKTARACTQASADLADCWLVIGFLEQDAKNAEAAKEAYGKYLDLAPNGKYAGDVKKLQSRL